MNRVVHFEIQAENLERASAFYKNVFGWEIKKWDGPVEYWMITTGPKDQPGINGGLLKRNGPTPAEGASVNAYVCTMDVTDIDEAIAKITEQGGVIAVPKMEIPQVGWLAYAKDTEGNIFGVMQDTSGMQK